MHCTEDEIQALAPYEGQAFHDALARVLESPLISNVILGLFPKLQLPEFTALVRSLTNADNFQAKIIAPAIKSLLKRANSELSSSGVEKLDPSRCYLFISNHRDIICDTALVSYTLNNSGRRSSACCLGDNLLTNPWARDLIKVNKGITVKRDLTPRELMRWSVALSTLIRRSVTSGKDSVWLAQQEGRAKDGDDRTHPGVLKMLSLSGEQGEPLDRLQALPIATTSLSYELDPCDAMKAREMWMRARDGKYTKAPGEDQKSMVLGMQGHKGRIHLTIGGEMPDAFDYARGADNRKEQLARLAQRIDRQLHLDYRLWPTNYIAYDLREGNDAMKSHYSDDEKRQFIERMDSQLAQVTKEKAERDAIRPHFLAIYANPVRNSIAARP